jgi:hypothetical protein
MDPALEGTVLSFSCPPPQVLIGPNATTTENGNQIQGKWNAKVHDTVIIITSFTFIALFKNISMHGNDQGYGK